MPSLVRFTLWARRVRQLQLVPALLIALGGLTPLESYDPPAACRPWSK